MSDIKKISTWCNEDNQTTFYNHAHIQPILEGYAHRGGLEKGADLETFYPLIKDSLYLLDVGAGYGRTIKCLLDKNFQGEIHAIEKSDLFFQELKRFGPKIKPHHGDILQYTGEIFDVILCMWSGISDFSKSEQPLFIKKLASLVNKRGKIFIDTFISDEKPINAQDFFEQNYFIKENECSTYGYLPTNAEIQIYCKQADLVIEKYYTYLTDAGRKRLIYILKPREAF